MAGGSGVGAAVVVVVVLVVLVAVVVVAVVVVVVVVLVVVVVWARVARGAAFRGSRGDETALWQANAISREHAMATRRMDPGMVKQSGGAVVDGQGTAPRWRES